MAVNPNSTSPAIAAVRATRPFRPARQTTGPRGWSTIVTDRMGEELKLLTHSFCAGLTVLLSVGPDVMGRRQILWGEPAL